MPDLRSHRGAHPEDASLFGSDRVPGLREAVADLSWLLDRGYAWTSSLKLVGDRFELRERQRTSVRRAACAAEAGRGRAARRVERAEGERVLVDGFNVLTTVEAALGGGVLLRCRDGCLRDMASMHGSYRRVEETRPAIDLVGATLVELGAASVTWLLDQPVSNSGRLATILREVAAERGWPWKAELVPDPDPLLAAAHDAVVATSDSGILDRCGPWLDLARLVVDRHVGEAWLLDL